jgi:hypothetical protein
VPGASESEKRLKKQSRETSYLLCSILVGKGSATEERADGARAFEAPHIAIADELGAAFLCVDGITS